MDKLIPIVFAVAGVALVVFGSNELRYGYSSNHWKTTQGVVIESRLKDMGNSSKPMRKKYHPSIVYSYTVDRTAFTSDRILFGMATYSTPFKHGSARAKEWVRKYPNGANVTVTFNPNDPSQSTLVAGPQMTAWVIPVMGIPFLFVGLFYRPSKRHKKIHKEED